MILKKNFSLKSLNTLQLESTAENFVDIQTDAELQTLLKNHPPKKIPWRILGGGSNLVLPSMVSGLVIKMSTKNRRLIGEDSDFWYVKAQSGEVWHDFVQFTLQQGYPGLENLSLIPGTVGAAPIQNIGAYGVEIKDSLHQLTALDISTGELRTFDNRSCNFSYRDSFFKQEASGKFIITDVIFRLSKKAQLHLDYGDIKKEIEKSRLPMTATGVSQAVINIRRSKLPDPANIGNAGSFFKNPLVSKNQRNHLLQMHPQLVSFPYDEDSFKLAAGWLIDQAGWKGKNLGPVGMYEKQALVLVNHGGANSQDVWRLAEEVMNDVFKKFSVALEPEPIRW